MHRYTLYFVKKKQACNLRSCGKHSMKICVYYYNLSIWDFIGNFVTNNINKATKYNNNIENPWEGQPLLSTW